MAGNQYYSTNDETGRDGYLSEFDAQRAALARRRRLAQMLQQQSMQQSSNIVNPSTGGRTSWLAPIAQMFQAYAGKSMGDSADAESRTNAAAEQTAMESALANAPQGTPMLPAQAMGPPTPDTERMPMLPQPPTNFGPPQGGAPSLGQQMVQPAAPNSGMLPQLPKQMPPAPAAPPEPAGMTQVPGEMSQQPEQPAQPPTAQDLFKYASGLARFGNPVATKVAETVNQRAMDTAYPKPMSEEARLKIMEIAATRDATQQSKAEALAQREREMSYRDAQRGQELAYRDAQHQQNIDARYDLARVVGAASAGNMVNEGTSLAGHQLYRPAKGVDLVEVVDGQSRPYFGPVVRPGEEKNVTAAMTTAKEAKFAEDLAKRVDENPDIFKVRANIGNAISSAFGGMGREALTGLTPEQIQLRGVIGRDFAETTKKLYGASFTTSEQQRANTFTPQPQDSAATIASKLRGAAEFAREMEGKYGSKITQAAAARAGSAAPAKGGGSSVDALIDQYRSK